MRTLLVDEPLHPDTEVTLEGHEARHGRTVLRLRPGDALRLCDGQGGLATAEVTVVERHHLRCRVASVEQVPPPALHSLTIAVAPPKGARFEDMVRGLTELGIGAVCPLLCERSERQPRLERAERVAAEALKQCRRSVLPRIGPALDIPALASTGQRLILADPDGGLPCPGVVAPTIIVIGPEGGLSAAERTSLLDAGAEPVRLAVPILRIETAALAAAAVWAATWEHHDH
ncbi:MAG: RsmE family RNA methyltransferase [Planctomycetota bacterium]|jgi:16S rRNA (uracil1498-N3)-methyltransferase